MMEPSPALHSAVVVTDHEEQLWLLQLQFPEAVYKQVFAWRMPDHYDAERLQAALIQVIEHVPALNVRYRFDDDGGLTKLLDRQALTCIQRLAVKDEQAAAQWLRREQAAPWDAETQAPLQAMLLGVGQRIFLGFVVHQILDRVCRADDLYRMTLNAYAGHPIGEPHLPWLQTAADAVEAAPTSAAANDDRVQALILGEFRQALNEPGMTANDDFFDFGGHSLLATRIIGRLSGEHGVHVRFNDFFSASSASALAARAQCDEITTEAAPATTPQATADQVPRAPFAPAQASLGRAYQAFDFGTVFNLPFAMELLDTVDETVFEQAFHDLVVRHASLRTTYHFDDGEPYQRLVPLTELDRYTWFWSSAQSHGVTLADEAAHRFDLARELPMRVRFLRQSGQATPQLSLLVHHMAIDEWSLNVMMQELAHAYQARAQGRAPHWSAPVPSFHAYALQAQAAGLDAAHLAYWTDMLREATSGLSLPPVNDANGRVDAPLPEASATDARWFEITPDQATVDGLYAFARYNDASLFGVLYSAIALALHKVGGLEDLVIGTSASGRTDPAYYDTVGYFTTMVAHRVQFDAQQPAGELIESVSRLINDSMAYADVPMEQIQQALGMTPEQGLLFDVYVQIHANNALNGALTGADGEPIRYRQIDPEKNQSMFGMQFEIMENVIEGRRVLRLVVTYATARYSAAQMAKVTAVLERLLQAFTHSANATRPVAEL